MALRLSGEEFSVVRGLDAQGWVRSIKPSDGQPGLEINQSGAGLGLKVTAGDVDLNSNMVKNARLGTDLDANSWNISGISTMVIGGLAGQTDTVRIDRIAGANGYLRISMWGSMNHTNFQYPINAADGVVTKVKAGAPTDGDFVWVADGLLAVDSTNGRLYFRYGGAWHYVAQTA